MKASHTPGPWKFRRYSQSDEDLAVMERLGMAPTLLLANDGSAPIMAGDVRVALVDCHTKFKRGEGYKTLCPQREANARLIAAAPELLQTLKQIQELTEGATGGMHSEIHQLAAAAIEKLE